MLDRQIRLPKRLKLTKLLRPPRQMILKFGRELGHKKEIIPEAKKKNRPAMWVIQITECARRNEECDGELEERNSAKSGSAVKCI